MMNLPSMYRVIAKNNLFYKIWFDNDVYIYGDSELTKLHNPYGPAIITDTAHYYYYESEFIGFRRKPDFIDCFKRQKIFEKNKDYTRFVSLKIFK